MTSILNSAARIATMRRVALVVVGAALLGVGVRADGLRAPAGCTSEHRPANHYGQPGSGSDADRDPGDLGPATRRRRSPTSGCVARLLAARRTGPTAPRSTEQPPRPTSSPQATWASRFGSRATATNAEGQSVKASNATAAVTVQAGPPNTALPTITGSAVVGESLTANPETWTGTGITFAYLWSRCDAAGTACTDIATATASTYTVVTADAGKTLRVKVTATNASGSNAVTSAPSAVVTTAPAPPATGCPTGTGPIKVADLSPPARLLIDRQQITPSPVTSGTQTIRIRLHVSACGGRTVEGALVYATPTPYQQFSATEQPTGADGWAVLTMRRTRVLPGQPAATAARRVYTGPEER